jgi:hypothetical protein
MLSHDAGPCHFICDQQIVTSSFAVPAKPVSNVTDSRIQPTLDCCAGAAKLPWRPAPAGAEGLLMNALLTG